MAAPAVAVWAAALRPGEAARPAVAVRGQPAWLAAGVQRAVRVAPLAVLAGAERAGRLVAAARRAERAARLAPAARRAERAARLAPGAERAPLVGAGRLVAAARLAEQVAARARPTSLARPIPIHVSRARPPARLDPPCASTTRTSRRGIACGSGATTACSTPDSCDGAGNCSPHNAPAGTDCGVCQQCNSAGSCVAGYEGTQDPTGCSAPQACAGMTKTTAERCSGGLCVASVTSSCPYGCAGYDCAPPTCGNNLVEPPEQCDDGNSSNLDLCSYNCKTCGILTGPALSSYVVGHADAGLELLA